MKLSKLLRYRFASWLIAKGLRFFIKETIVPKKYHLDVGHDQNLLLSHLFASQILHKELDNNTDAGIGYLAQRKAFTITVGNPLFSLYIHFTKCLAEVYGDATPLMALNDAILARGIASIYEDIVQGNLPIINQLPAEEVAVMQRMREYMEAEAKRQTEAVEQAMKETKEHVN